MTKAFGLTMRGIIKKDEKILLLKRHPKSKNGPCQWELPGGKVERNEFFDEGLVREIKEETSLNVSVDSFCEAVQQDFPNRSTVQVIMYLNLLDDCDVKISDEHVDYTWAGISEVKNLDITSSLKKVLTKRDWKI